MTEETKPVEEVKTEEAPVVKKEKKDPVKEYAQKLTAVEQEKEDLKRQLEEMKTGELERSNNFKALYEQEKSKRELAEQTAKRTRDTYIKDLKMKSIREEALKSGSHESAVDDLELLDHSLVEIETTSTGRYSVLGAKEFVDSIKEKRPYWFQDKTPPNINSGRPSGIPKGEYSAEELLKLEKDNKPEYYKVMASILRGKK